MQEDKQILARDNKKEILKRVLALKKKLENSNPTESQIVNQKNNSDPVNTIDYKDEEEVELPLRENPLASRERKTKILATVMLTSIIFIIGLGVYLSNKPVKQTNQIHLEIIPSRAPSPTMTIIETPPEATVEPTPEVIQIDTANWKTYINDEIGFSVKFPDNWFVSENNSGGLRLSNKVSDGNSTFSDNQVNVDFYYFHSALENYSETPREYKTNDGIILIEQGIYINESSSFGVITTKTKEASDINLADDKINEIISSITFLN